MSDGVKRPWQDLDWTEAEQRRYRQLLRPLIMDSIYRVGNSHYSLNAGTVADAVMAHLYGECPLSERDLAGIERLLLHFAIASLAKGDLEMLNEEMRRQSEDN
jgi:hypothetical protein